MQFLQKSAHFVQISVACCMQTTRWKFFIWHSFCTTFHGLSENIFSFEICPGEMICTTFYKSHSRSRGFRCMHKRYHCAAQKRVGNTRLGLLCRGGTALSIPMYIQLLILFGTEIQFTKKKGSKREVNYSMECTQKSTSCI